MANGKIVRALLSEEPVSIDRIAGELAEATNGLGAGSLVVFMGFVKGVVDGRRVYTLSYEAAEHAREKLLEIAREEAETPGVYAVTVVHRVGSLKPGEPTIYIFVVAEPRSLAFRVAERLLDRVKHEAPIYKLEAREDGEYWILGDHTRIRRGELLDETEEGQRQVGGHAVDQGA